MFLGFIRRKRFRVKKKSGIYFDKKNLAPRKFGKGFGELSILEYLPIDTQGKFLNDKQFLDLGIFHKEIATAKDENGCFHCDKAGNSLYLQRYSQIKVFYNGFALVQNFDNQKLIINERGEIIIIL